MGCRDEEQTGHGLYRWGTVWTWAVERRHRLYTAHFQTVPHPYSHVHRHPSVHPMSSLYLISTSHIQTVPKSIAKFHQNPVCIANDNSVPNLYIPCPDSTQTLQPMSSQYHIFTAHVQILPHIYHQCPVCILYCPYYPHSTKYLKPISSQYLTFTANVKMVSHLCMPSSESTHHYNSCLVGTLSLQHISIQNPICTADVHSVPNL